jgi:hypothetical protein
MMTMAMVRYILNISIFFLFRLTKIKMAPVRIINILIFFKFRLTTRIMVTVRFILNI